MEEEIYGRIALIQKFQSLESDSKRKPLIVYGSPTSGKLSIIRELFGQRSPINKANWDGVFEDRSCHQREEVTAYKQYENNNKVYVYCPDHSSSYEYDSNDIQYFDFLSGIITSIPLIWIINKKTLPNEIEMLSNKCDIIHYELSLTDWISWECSANNIKENNLVIEFLNENPDCFCNYGLVWDCAVKSVNKNIDLNDKFVKIHIDSAKRYLPISNMEITQEIAKCLIVIDKINCRIPTEHEIKHKFTDFMKSHFMDSKTDKSL